jgi:hypothetical protein
MFFIDVIIQWDYPYTPTMQNPRRQHNKQKVKLNTTTQYKKISRRASTDIVWLFCKRHQTKYTDSSRADPFVSFCELDFFFQIQFFIV